MRAEVLQTGRDIQDAETRLAAASLRHKRAVAALRQACPHDRLIEVDKLRPLRDGHKDDSGQTRFCLQCGEVENAQTLGGRSGLRLTFSYVKLTAVPIHRRPEKPDLEHLMEHLYRQARLDEFGPDGRWLGETAMAEHDDSYRLMCTD